MKVVKRINPKSAHHTHTFFSISLILYLYEMMDAHEACVIVLYTLSLYTAVCQLYLNKTGRKKKKMPLS